MKLIFIIGFWLGLIGWGALEAEAQKRPDNNDYQYALIEAVKQKNLGKSPNIELFEKN